MIRPIAIHLPQFHPFTENDEWWGRGFTEWTNVTKATPLFKNHYQPHLPADLGFYDLRLAEARLAQEALAKESGIYGFCYYHYWFNGKRLLNEPVDRKLKNPKEDFPFMLCWANENWTRRWDGQDQEVLIEQNYSEADDIEHIKFLIKHFFKDNRYIKIENKPFLAIYRVGLFPNAKKTALVWDAECKKAGFDGIYLAYMNREGFKQDPLTINFEASIDFKPDFINNPIHQKSSILKRLVNKLGLNKNDAYINNQIIDYKDFVTYHLNLKKPAWKNFPGLTPSWDNSARRLNGNAFILKNSTPELYGNWLKKIIENFKPYSNQESFIFINAWNEWAEGNHLEPCQKWGNQYLAVTKKVLESE